MPKAPLRNLHLHHGSWRARMLVPQDVRGLLGIAVLTQSLGTDDPHLAAVKAKPIISGWKTRIAEARRGVVTAWGDNTELRRLAAAHREAHRLRAAGEDDGYRGTGEDHARDDIVDYVLKHFEPEGFDARQAAYESHQGDVYEALRLHPRGQKAVEMLELLTETRTALESLVSAWGAHLQKGKIKARQAAMYLSDAREFCRATSAWIETLDKRAVQAWLDREIDAGRITVKTLRRKLSSLRNLWTFVQKTHPAVEDKFPFREPNLPREAVKRGVTREHFDAPDVVRLWTQATGDGPLQSLIILAAYTGARIEELCLLRREHVDMEAAVMTIPGTKTNAAARKVPIHTALGPIVAKLLKQSQDGYLILSTSKVAHGARASALSKRFGKMKTKLGYSPALVFHSTRKTVATLLERSGCPEGVAADILGHEKTTMTYGLYSGGTSMEQRREWLEKAMAYPSPPPVPQVQ